MTRSELKEYISNTNFEFICKVKGDKRKLRYHFDRVGYWYLLIVDYNNNAISLSIHYKWPNERIESKFDYLYVHDLNIEQLNYIMNIFTR